MDIDAGSPNDLEFCILSFKLIVLVLVALRKIIDTDIVVSDVLKHLIINRKPNLLNTPGLKVADDRRRHLEL